MNFFGFVIAWRGTVRVAVALALAILASSVSAQSAYPARPIKLVVPYPAGALTDLLARAIGERLGAELKQPVVVDNRPGAGTLVGSVNFFLIASPDFPARTMPELIETLRRPRGKYNYASVGSGSPHHLFMEALKKELALDIEHIPYKGTSAALADILSGRVQVMFADATAAVPNIQAGKRRQSAHPLQSRQRFCPRFSIAATSRFRLAGVAGDRRAGANTAGNTDEARSGTATHRDGARVSRAALPVRDGTGSIVYACRIAAFIASEQPRWAKAVKDSGAKVD